MYTTMGYTSKRGYRSIIDGKREESTGNIIRPWKIIFKDRLTCQKGIRSYLRRLLPPRSVWDRALCICEYTTMS